MRNTPMPLPWKMPIPAPATPYLDAHQIAIQARHSYGQYCVEWAQHNPIQALIVVLPIWYFYAALAPSIAATGFKHKGAANLAFVYVTPIKMGLGAVSALIGASSPRPVGK